MGILFAAECDVCGVRQVKEHAHELEGSTYMENSVQKFICPKCKGLMKASFEIKKGGLRNPLFKVAGLIKQRDKALRQRDEALGALDGTNPFPVVRDLKKTHRLGKQSVPLETRPLPKDEEDRRKSK